MPKKSGSKKKRKLSSIKEARKRATEIHNIITCWDLSYTVVIFLEDGSFNFHPIALAMTWRGFYFVFPEHSKAEVYCKDEVRNIHQCQDVPIESDEIFLRDLKQRMDQVQSIMPETVQGLLEE